MAQLPRRLPNGENTNFTYDAAGNVLTKTDIRCVNNTLSYSYDENNRMATVSDLMLGYIQSDPKHPMPGAANPVATFNYYAAGRTASIVFGNGVTQSLQYDGAGQTTYDGATKNGSTLIF